VDKLLQEKNLTMAVDVVRKLQARGLISSEEDATAKLSDEQWVNEHGYEALYRC
jgi:hypothetical protein